MFAASGISRKGGLIVEANEMLGKRWLVDCLRGCSLLPVVTGPLYESNSPENSN